MIGKIVLHYKVLEKLGEGGMGVVYKAEDTKLKREVAIKFLPHHISANEEERQRFEIEAQAAASLNHPNISTIYSIEDSDDQVFIVMEYIDGVELKDKIKSGNIPTEEAINIAIQIAEGLEAAHKKGIVHRDIKAGNIMISENGKVKIMDFGLAKVGKGTQLTKIGSTVGTIAYMSPEQSRGEELDHRTDIWSFGVVLYEMLTGKQPFKGDYDQAVIYSILNEEPESAESISSELNSIINKALSKDLGNRYQSVSEMLSDLNELRNDSSNKTYSQPLKITSLSKKRNKKWFVPAAVLSLIIILVAAYFFFNNKSVETTTNERKMIVVLPFENSGSPEDEYFADGITEEITSRLSGLSGLGVIARTSAKLYKNVNKPLNQIAEELGVGYVLVGTIRWEKTGEGSRVKINPELIRVNDGVQIWSEPFEAPYSSSFKLQSQIAAQVANAMDIKLLQPEKKSLSISLTKNQEAYNLYLKAIDFIDNRNPDPKNQQFAERLLKQAIDLDSNFAAAYAGLSRVYSTMYWFHYDHTENRINMSKQAADKAFQLNPDLYRVYSAFAWYYYHCELDYDKALENFHQALKLQPNDDDAPGGIGAILRRQGKIEESIQFFEKVVNINPLSAKYLFELAITYFWNKKYSEVIPRIQKSRSLDPNSPEIYYYLSACYIQGNDLTKAKQILNEASKDGVPDKNGFLVQRNIQIDIYERNYERALNRLKNIALLFNDQFSFMPGDLTLGIINLHLGRNEEAKKSFNSAISFLNQKITESPDDSRLYSSLGIAYAGLGQKEYAIKWAKKGVELLPVSKEALRGQARLNDLAKVYVMVGEYDLAIDLLKKLINIPSEITSSILRIDPTWDKLRGNKKFDELVSK